ncbi:MAG: IPT/TIG domain-containing protein [Methanoregulaceae archaeon]|nr:IPT/TIG domain-containing protein [Methanoregulaceae archaeon]
MKRTGKDSWMNGRGAWLVYGVAIAAAICLVAPALAVPDDNPAAGIDAVPAINNLNPASRNSGTPGFTLHVWGTNFTATSVVRWNGVAKATTFLAPNHITATIPAADVATSGNKVVRVRNPGPTGGLSNPAIFKVKDIPAITRIRPTTRVHGMTGFALYVDGNHFLPTSRVRWNGVEKTTTYISATRVQAIILAADIATAGNRVVRVRNPGDLGGLSNAVTFTVT